MRNRFRVRKLTNEIVSLTSSTLSFYKSMDVTFSDDATCWSPVKGLVLTRCALTGLLRLIFNFWVNHVTWGVGASTSYLQKEDGRVHAADSCPRAVIGVDQTEPPHLETCLVQRRVRKVPPNRTGQRGRQNLGRASVWWTARAREPVPQGSR